MLRCSASHTIWIRAISMHNAVHQLIRMNPSVLFTNGSVCWAEPCYAILFRSFWTDRPLLRLNPRELICRMLIRLLRRTAASSGIFRLVACTISYAPFRLCLLRGRCSDGTMVVLPLVLKFWQQNATMRTIMRSYRRPEHSFWTKRA